MKNKLFIIALIGLCLSASRANPQTSKGTTPPKASNVPAENPDLSCLEKLNTAIQFSYDLWILGLTACHAANTPPNPASYAECQTLVNDMNTVMLQMDLNRYSICVGTQE